MAPLPPLLLLLLLLPAAVYKGTFGETHLRNRRGILELAGAIKCTTGRSPFAYLRYGCYCGLGGKGWPKDRVDWCCFHHDCCYGRAEQAGCQPKTESYHWECEDHSAVCDGQSIFSLTLINHITVHSYLAVEILILTIFKILAKAAGMLSGNKVPGIMEKIKSGAIPGETQKKE